MTPISTVSGVALHDVGHRFRGDFFDRCGSIERWLTLALTQPGALARPCGDKAFLGEKLKKVREIATADLNRPAKILKRPEKVLRLLDRFQPYADLRGVLGHSTQTVAISQGEEILFLYQSMGGAPWSQVALTEASQGRILRALQTLMKEFGEQKLVAGS